MIEENKIIAYHKENREEHHTVLQTLIWNNSSVNSFEMKKKHRKKAEHISGRKRSMQKTSRHAVSEF